MHGILSHLDHDRATGDGGPNTLADTRQAAEIKPGSNEVRFTSNKQDLEATVKLLEWHNKDEEEAACDCKVGNDGIDPLGNNLLTLVLGLLQQLRSAHAQNKLWE